MDKGFSVWLGAIGLIFMIMYIPTLPVITTIPGRKCTLPHPVFPSYNCTDFKTDWFCRGGLSHNNIYFMLSHKQTKRLDGLKKNMDSSRFYSRALLLLKTNVIEMWFDSYCMNCSYRFCINPRAKMEHNWCTVLNPLQFYPYFSSS